MDEESGARTSALTLPTTLIYSDALVVCRFTSETTTATSDPASLTLECKHNKSMLQRGGVGCHYLHTQSYINIILLVLIIS